MATLFVIKGADEGKRFELTAAVNGAGRDMSNTIRLHDTEASRRHAEFRQVGDAHVLLDLGSSNGTLVNNLPIREARLQPGDHVQIGQTILVYTASPGDYTGPSDLADKISMISRSDLEVPSAIVRAISEGEGSRLLAQPHQAGGAWLKNALASLSVMYQTTQAVSHILDIDQLLERIMDLIFQSIEADRGCIMLRNHETHEFEPKAVRWRAGVDRQEKITISRTIMDHVLKAGQGVLVTDASHDDRFTAGHSIVRFGIREALCVPMKGRHETLGVLYLDTRSNAQEIVTQKPPAGRLTEDHLMLAIAIGHQAAMALEETHYYQAMVQSERLAAIGQTIAALSHHIKNILQGLRTGTELLKMGIEEHKEPLLLQGWRAVEKNQGRIYELVMDMLSYSKEREPALEPTDVNAIIHEVLELMQGRIETQNIRLQTRLDEHLPIIQADPEGLHRALLNIVSNAIDALEGRENASLGVLSTLENDGRWVRIAVTDNGVGIPLSEQADLFRPFMSTKGSRGTGLGLAVSRKTLREHGGDIFVQSQPGKGSRFALRLPVHSPLHSGASLTMNQTLLPEARGAD